ncbi:MAG: RsmB/NOP family class I SAM-dependent RNA methyltransferase [Alphaproteobacteria bacterium]|nr:RsmB/NOP family class I SAM-dependent RNA methyltransferase [Alphaproteobacteria bacterium]MBP9877554.1 RsmB/NOP family class I SAM-dependent RNA methyltransferase [Alphaproteobacteria bacterium]
MTNSSRQASPSPRQAALRLIIASRLDKLTFDEAIQQENLYKHFNPQERKFIRSLYAAFFRHFGQTQTIMKLFFKPKSDRSFKEAACLICLGLTELLFLKTDDHAAIHSAVELSKTKKLAGFQSVVNAVLRRSQRARDNGSLAKKVLSDDVLAVPYWIQRKIQPLLSNEDLIKLAQIYQSTPPLDLYITQDAEKWAETLKGDLFPPATIRIQNPEGQIENLEGFSDGVWWVQDLSATLPVYLFSDIKGKTVHDLCAAPGGKSLQLAHLGAHVIAYDKSADRLERVKENADRTKLPLTIVEQDFFDFKPTEFLDNILLDAPCSATGTMRRHPELGWIKEEEDILPLLSMQKGMLRKASRLLAKGGTLVYCTCSLLPEEGERQIETFLKENPDFETFIPDQFQPLIAHYQLKAHDNMIRTWPHSFEGQNGMDGFFMCAIRHKR